MTVQIPDTIHYEGIELPLEEGPELPEGHLRILTVRKDPNANYITEGSWCWRGYIASWSVKQGRLYLESIFGDYALSEGDALLADWYSGKLMMPTGGQLKRKNIHIPRWEKQFFAEVKNGLIVRTWNIENKDKDDTCE